MHRTVEPEFIGRRYDDFLFRPQPGVVTSRRDVSLTTRLSRRLSLELPIVSANMDSVTEPRWPKPWRSRAGSGSSTGHAYSRRRQRPWRGSSGPIATSSSGLCACPAARRSWRPGSSPRRTTLLGGELRGRGGAGRSAGQGPSRSPAVLIPLSPAARAGSCER